jgi:hypothetical protein
LAPTEEAVGVYRRLVEGSPGAYLPDLASSLNNLSNRLSELGRREQVPTAVRTVWEGLGSGPRAELRLALSRWLIADDDDSERHVAVLAEAAAEADTEQHPQHGARARRAVRAAVAGADLTARLAQAGAPAWAIADIPEGVIEIINEAVAAPTWAEAANVLRSPEAGALFAPAGRRARAVLTVLHSDKPQVVTVLQVLDDIDDRGLDAVLDQLCADEQHRNKVLDWLRTPDWTDSRNHLNTHRDLLTDPRTGTLLAQLSGDREARRHLAIVRLAAGRSLDEVYDIVLDRTDAEDAALAAIDTADLDLLTEIWHASLHLPRQPFLAPYLRATLIVHAGGPDSHDHARKLVNSTAQLRAVLDNADDQTGQAARLRQQIAASPTRLHKLAERHPAHAAILHELATLLTTPPDPGTITADQPPTPPMTQPTPHAP